MLNLNSILLFSEKPEPLANFYQQVLMQEPVWQESGYTTFEAGTTVITIGPHDSIMGNAQQPERIMLNFETENVPAEFERLKSLGASIVKEPYNPSEMPESMIATLADPDGNYFQLVSPMNFEQEK